jgi:hypothetical protein
VAIFKILYYEENTVIHPSVCHLCFMQQQMRIHQQAVRDSGMSEGHADQCDIP